MKKTHNTLIFKALFLTLFIPVLALADAKITAVGGASTVPVKRGAQAIQMKAGDSIVPGDEITTDGKTAVDVTLEDNTVIRIGVNSVYRLQENSKIKKIFHELFSGIVRVLVPPAKNKTGDVKFRLNTPEGTIGVRGTEFVVIRKKNDAETQLKGLSGEVLFGSDKVDFNVPATYVPVRAGFESSIRAGQAKPAAAKSYDMNNYKKGLERKEGGPFAPIAMSFAGRSSGESLAANAPVKSMNIGSSGTQEEAAPAAKDKDAAKAGDKAQKVDGNRMLVDAIAHGQFENIVAAVKKYNADVNLHDDFNNTPLHMVIASGELPSSKKLEALELLLDEKSKLNVQNQNGHSPLMLVAMETEDADLMQLLLKRGADTSLKDVKGKTALELAKERQKNAMVELLER